MGSHTPYDDVFRTLTVDCSSLLLPVLNEVFGEHYTGDEKIVFSQNEHFFRQQDGRTSERITDSSFAVFGKTVKQYHFECQSTPDNSILLRMFEYDVQIAIEDSVLEGERLTVKFPASAVLFLREQGSIPEQMEIKLVTPEGSISYMVPTMKASAYELEEIFSKRLYFLLPFYIFRYEKQFGEMEENEERLKQLKERLEELNNRLEQLTEKGELNEYTKCTITEMTDKVVMHIARRYEQVRKGVKQVMGGQVLEYEAKTILNRGRAEGLREGLSQGLQEGEALKLILLVCRKLAKGKEAPQIAEELEEDLDRIEEICVAAGQCGPEYDREKIYALLQSKGV